MNHKKLNIIIKQTDAIFSSDNLDGPKQRIIGPAQFRFGRDYIYMNDMDEENDRYEKPGCRSFTDIQIVEGQIDINARRWNVLHIFLNDVILHSATYLITYLNEVFENINYPLVFGPNTYNHKIFENEVMERHDFYIVLVRKLVIC